jgi:hypothetical protein
METVRATIATGSVEPARLPDRRPADEDVVPPLALPLGTPVGAAPEESRGSRPATPASATWAVQVSPSHQRWSCRPVGSGNHPGSHVSPSVI